MTSSATLYKLEQNVNKILAGKTERKGQKFAKRQRVITVGIITQY